MLLFWSLTGAAGLLAGLWMAWPFLRAHSVALSGADEAISIYRDQLDEVERDRAAGMISARDCDAARQEIERRALQAARELNRGFAASRRSLPAAAAMTALVAVSVVAAYALLGTPEAGDQPLAARQTERLSRMAEAGDISSRIQLLIRATQDDPDSFEDWWMLARSYGAIGDHASAADAYRNAARLSGDRPAVLSAYGEAMTLANGNKVPSAARLIFERLARDTADPRARYYIALAKAQSQDFQGAVADWAALAGDSAPDAPWMPLVRRDIVNMARFLEQDVTEFLPDASPTEIAAAGGTGLLPAPDSGEIADIEAALAEDPKDYKGWIALARARSIAGDAEGAAEAIGAARRHYAGAPFVLQKLAEAERALGLDLVTASPSGPSTEDIAAAADMTQSERDDMIAGMVAGLAARLEEQPNDPDGWVMLVRSYATLGQHDKANEAFARAMDIFSGDETVLRALQTSAGTLINQR